MKINSASEKLNRTNFGSAQINILATSDNHGNIHSLPRLIKTVEVNNSDIFVHSTKPETLNVLAIVGDWFINPSKKGFMTRPELTNGDLQLTFLKHFVRFVHKFAGGGDNFLALFDAGNHDCDGGDEFLYKVINNAPVKTLVTNVNMDKSPVIKQLTESSGGAAATSIVKEIPDNKDPNMKHKVLFIGVSIPTMEFYNPGLMKNMEFLDNGNVKDSALGREDIKNTINSVKKEVEEFKKQYPKGAVIMLSHMGNKLAEYVVEQVPDINVVLNGHDHVDKTRQKGKTTIHSLGKDNELLKAIKLLFNDEGDLDAVDVNTFFTGLTISDDLDKHPTQIMLDKALEDDVLPVIKLKDMSGNMKELSYGNEIRYSNSFLANYLTSAVKRSVREVEPEVFSVGLMSSIVRGGLKNESSNLDIMKIFDGVSEDLSNLMIGSVSGKELTGIIVENILSNLKAPTRNTIIHWSDVQVNRTLIKKLRDENAKDGYMDAIKVRNPETKEFEPIEPDKEYKIVLPEKYLIKEDIEWPRKIRDGFVSLHKTYDELFKQYLKNVGYDVRITEKTKEARIL